jgi:hypothetical protein
MLSHMRITLLLASLSQLGDEDHEPHYPLLCSEIISITVK